MGEKLDVWKCWDSSFGFFLWLYSRVVYIGATRLMGLFAANSSLSVFLLLRVVRAARFLGSLFTVKLGEELDVSVLWVELDPGL